MKGIVFNIQRYSIYDGPGIRTTVFFKGCNLNCYWCHNPESINIFPEIQFFVFKCTNCKKCIYVCPNSARIFNDSKGVIILREKCTRCGSCIRVCAAKATNWVGKEISVKQVVQEIEKDCIFYKISNGGVTFSGGEPLIQLKFLINLLKKCKERGIHTAVDTAGNLSWKNIRKVIPYVDLFLYDLKLVSKEKHKKVTGICNNRILRNLVLLSKENINIVIRIPIIPGINDSVRETSRIIKFLKKLDNILYIEILNFHQFGAAKYISLGREYYADKIKPLNVNRMTNIARLYKENGLKLKSIGFFQS